MKKTTIFLIYLLVSISFILIIKPVKALDQNQYKTDSLINLLKTAKEDSNKVKILYRLSTHFLSGEPDKSLDYSNQMLSLAQKLNLKKYTTSGYINIGAYYYYRSDNNLAREYFEKALALIKQPNDKLALCMVYGALSSISTRQNDYPSAIDYSDKAIQIAEDLKDSSGLATNLSNRSNIYLNISDYSTALKYLFKALSINEKIKDKKDMASNYYFIGDTYRQENYYDKAINYFQLAINEAKETDNKVQLAQALNRIGEIFQEKKEWNKALDYFQQATVIGRKVKDFADIIASALDIGMIYCEQEKYDSAIQSVSNALELSQQVGLKISLGDGYGYLGEIYMKKKDNKTAINYLIKSLGIAKEIKEKENEAHELKKLAECYHALHNFKLQADYLTQYQAVNDTIMNEETIKKTAEMEVRYSLDKKEKEIALLTKDKQIQQLQIKKQIFLINSFVIGIVLFLILLFFVYRSYHIRQLLKLQTLRTKIASDLHDDIGSTLSSISIFTQMVGKESKDILPKLEQIGEYCRKMLDSMADIVWTINPENDNFEKIIFRMRSFAFELLRSKNIDFEFNADDLISDMKLSMEVRKNLYLIFKEATNNMAKYSEANSASVLFTGSSSNLFMQIKDNGKGFDTNQQTQGNGLKNIRNRATEIGAKLLIDSEPGKGTTIQLSIKAA